jgi:hypothetical protein
MIKIEITNTCGWCGKTEKETVTRSQWSDIRESCPSDLIKDWSRRLVMEIKWTPLGGDNVFTTLELCNRCSDAAEKTDKRARQAAERAHEKARLETWEMMAVLMDARKQKAVSPIRREHERDYCQGCHQETVHEVLSGWHGKPYVCTECGQTVSSKTSKTLTRQETSDLMNELVRKETKENEAK